MDFNFVTTRLAVGGTRGQLNAWDIEQIKTFGITHVLCVRTELDELWPKSGLHLCHNPTFDDGTHKPNEWFQKSLSFGLLTLGRPNKKLLVCCFLGMDRSPSTALAILLASGFTVPEAEVLIQRSRPGATMRYGADAVRATRELGYV